MKKMNSLIAFMKQKAFSYMYHSNFGFNSNKYFFERNVALNSNCCLLRKIIAVRYVSKINKKFNANVFTGIGCGATFASEPILPHQLSGIFIASTATIGKHVTILQQVTIGGNPDTFDGTSEISQAAKIGDNVIIGSGAKIIGNVHIGNNAIIGANAVVIHDVPNNCIAVGVPAQIKHRIIN